MALVFGMMTFQSRLARTLVTIHRHDGLFQTRKDLNMLTRFKHVLFGGIFTLILCDQAIAHAHLASANPAVDGAVAVSPAELDLKFSEAVNLKFSGVKVAGPDKATVATGDASLAQGDESMLVVPVSPALSAGAYTVDWHVLSKDGHKSHGTYKFTVKP
jgi:methionine-rich copper-binding protein CopC